MKYALFVLGLLLIVGGGYFVYTGSNIIEIERGWSSVIAGTTALTGGIVTLGLAGVAKSLDDLHRLWAAGIARPEAPAATTVAGPAAAPAEISDEALLGPIPAGVETAPLPVDMTFAAAEPTPAAPDVLPSPLGKPRLPPGFGPLPIPLGPSPAIAALRRRVADDLNLDFESLHPHPPAPPPIPAHAEAVPPEPIEAITPPPLDFIDFESKETISHRDFQRDEVIPADESSALEPPPLPATPESTPGPVPESVAAQPSGSAPKTIGRYEADGTVYVMFADGSIEAQSAEGTRHFRSMAELKASFESKT
jgi:hypothetical protein